MVPGVCCFNTNAQYLRELSAPAAVVLGDEPVELALCDCEFATGPPNGLSCDKEGWFVSSFEREGSWVRPLFLAPTSTLIRPFAAVHLLYIQLYTALTPRRLEFGQPFVAFTWLLSRARCCRQYMHQLASSHAVYAADVSGWLAH